MAFFVDSLNRASMDEIESSVMVFCLDEAKPDVSIYRKVRLHHMWVQHLNSVSLPFSKILVLVNLS